jgi:hypothetical protein
MPITTRPKINRRKVDLKVQAWFQDNFLTLQGKIRDQRIFSNSQPRLHRPLCTSCQDLFLPYGYGHCSIKRSRNDPTRCKNCIPLLNTGRTNLYETTGRFHNSWKRRRGVSSCQKSLWLKTSLPRLERRM